MTIPAIAPLEIWLARRCMAEGDPEDDEVESVAVDGCSVGFEIEVVSTPCKEEA